MKDQKTKERFIELRAEGWSYNRIARELKVSKQTLIDWSREFQLEIKNLRALQLDALREKYSLMKEKRIEFFGERLSAIRKALQKRDFSDIPTDRLYALLEKMETIFQRETAGAAVFAEKEEGDPTKALLKELEEFNKIRTWQG